MATRGVWVLWPPYELVIGQGSARRFPGASFGIYSRKGRPTAALSEIADELDITHSGQKMTKAAQVGPVDCI